MALIVMAMATLLAVMPAGAQSPSGTVNQRARLTTDQLGGVADKLYQGNGLSVTATPGAITS